VADEKLMRLLDAATTVILRNEESLGESRKVFPMTTEGVAQGSPLSPLFGNILLHQFDEELNKRDITFIRFIDDFLILGADPQRVKKAFYSGKGILGALNLDCHDPYATSQNREKSEHGHADDGFVFLGYQIHRGLYQPSSKAKAKLLKTIDDTLSNGRRSVRRVVQSTDSWFAEQRYAQTLVMVDRVVRGWGNAFSYSNSKSSLVDLDRKIDVKLKAFREWYRGFQRGLNERQIRRANGVGLLEDVRLKQLDDVPFRFSGKARFRAARDTIYISADGSAINGRRREPGPGAWAFVVHETGEYSTGRSFRTTNNEMELTAVVEAIKFAGAGASLHIYTDSQYVARTFNERQIVSSNTHLWKQVEELKQLTRIKISWVKGHNGDKFNEAADALANEEAMIAKAERDSSLGTSAA
jgi:ribonuclease HI